MPLENGYSSPKSKKRNSYYKIPQNGLKSSLLNIKKKKTFNYQYNRRYQNIMKNNNKTCPRRYRRKRE
jgi:hypothetical protein